MTCKSDKSARDLRSRQKNPEHDNYYKSRGMPGKPNYNDEDDDE